ncbi:MAG TPA: hypothetical protein VK553_02540 [Candidatus Nitrosopolaris rasttigaisensis]|nr:hypothetical protein [Candidatus Nitrosopolaris rasttigaisensis]
MGSFFKGLFGFKQAQADVVKSSLGVLTDAITSDGQKTTAIAAIIAAEAQSGYWLAACWRPLLMLEFATIIAMFWFGYVPPHFNDPMSPMMARIFDIIELGIGGYIPSRTLEKIVSQFNVAAIVKSLIDKKIL